MTEITVPVTESHRDRFDELCESMDVDVEAEIAQLVMRSIDETYRQEATQ